MDPELNNKIEAESSWRAGTKTRSQPAKSPGRASGKVTLRNVRSQPAPVTRAVSSSEGSIWRKAALAERTPSGMKRPVYAIWIAAEDDLKRQGVGERQKEIEMGEVHKLEYMQ